MCVIFLGEVHYPKQSRGYVRENIDLIITLKRVTTVTKYSIIRIPPRMLAIMLQSPIAI